MTRAELLALEAAGAVTVRSSRTVLAYAAEWKAHDPDATGFGHSHEAAIADLLGETLEPDPPCEGVKFHIPRYFECEGCPSASLSCTKPASEADCPGEAKSGRARSNHPFLCVDAASDIL